MEKKQKRGLLEHWQIVSIGLALFDAVAVNAAFYIALWLRYDCQFAEIPFFYIDALKAISPIYAVICIIVFKLCRMYNTLWRFAGMHECYLALFANALTLVFQILLTTVGTKLMGLSIGFERMPVTYYCIGIIFQFIFVMGIRLSYRIFLSVRLSREINGKRCMLIGAGAAGQMILNDINRSHSTNDRICCIIDDNPNKWNRYMEGVPIAGGRNDIFSCVEKYKIQKIIFAVPSASPEERRDILSICSETDCELKQVTLMYQGMGQTVDASSIHDVSIEDLLGRKPIEVDMGEVFEFISGKTIIVTGGGGSIGSELCRQIAAHRPKTLIIFDIYENNAYDIQLELRDRYPQLDLVTLIGSVRDSRRLQSVFAEYRPEIVFHAAAHKHVPLMEDSPCESVKNNAIGTYKTAYAAMTHGCKRFVLISTDKAVNPTNIMGASKRLCEMVIQTFDRMVKSGRASEMPTLSTHICPAEYWDGRTDTEFVAVRFGNVLGSNGSVVPLFKKQIAKGGPVTVTHPDIIRYFMTVPEAVSLVLQAGVYANGGEIFVLDMGYPMKIDSLARNLIKLSGLRPDVDIKIEYTGLRPGEKLYEEKLMAEEGLQKTRNNLIFVGHPLLFDEKRFLVDIRELMDAAYANRKDIKELVKSTVLTYTLDTRSEEERKEPEREKEPVSAGV